MGRVSPSPGVLVPRISPDGANSIRMLIRRDQRVLDETFLTLDRLLIGMAKRAQVSYLNRNPQQVPPNSLWALYGIKQSKGGR